MIAAVFFASVLAAAAPATRDVAADEARALYVEAKNAYDGGRFDEALAGFQAAFAKKPLPGFLFNLGQCERQLGHHERAIFFFERYLDEKPDANNRSTVEELIAESRAQLARTPAAPLPSTTATGGGAVAPQQQQHLLRQPRPRRARRWDRRRRRARRPRPAPLGQTVSMTRITSTPVQASGRWWPPAQRPSRWGWPSASASRWP